MKPSLFLYASLLLTMGTTLSFAQDSLSLEESVEIALANNHGITIARQNATISRNNVTKGNAGMLPRVFLQGGYTYSINNTKLEFANTGGNTDSTGASSSNQGPLSFTGAETRTLNGSINATYTLFNGFTARHTYDRLLINADLNNVQTRQAIESTLYNIGVAYYNLAKLNENYLLSQENRSISADRYARAQNKNDFGVSNSLEVLNAEVDLNTDSVNLLTAELNLENAKREFNTILSREVNEAFTVEREVRFQTDLSLENALANARQQNKALTIARYNQRLAELDLALAKAARYPQVNLNASYAYNRQNNEVGLLLLNQTNGFTGGVQVTFDIFDGNRKNLAIQNARVGIENSREQFEQIVEQVERDIQNAYATYQNRLYILEVQRRNLNTAQANFERTQDQYQYGQVTTTQFREAQLNLLNAKVRLSNARYDAKIAEVEVLRLSGQLVNEE